MGDNENHVKEAHPSDPASDKPAFGRPEEYSLADGDQIDRAVDDIVAKEGDEVLAAEDQANKEMVVMKPRRGLKNFFVSWWRNKLARYITVFVLLAAIVTLFLVPVTRYGILNLFGVRSSASLTVTDSVTHQPLKNVSVILAGKKVVTGSDGRAKFTHLKLGKANINITRPGFSPLRQTVTIGWGSNPFGTVGLKASGEQYTFVIKDYVTGKALKGVEVTSGESVALSNEQGKAILTTPGDNNDETPVELACNGYRTEQLTIKTLTPQPIVVEMVTARKAVYASRLAGQLDVYKSDVDGKNAQIILAATGNESDNMSLAVSFDGSHAAVVSTRSGQKDSQGNPLSTATLVDVNSGASTELAVSSQIKLIDWIDSALIFEQISLDKATPDASRYSVISYDFKTNSRYQLAVAANLKTVLSAQGNIYYGAAADADHPTLQGAYYRIAPDGGNKTTILEKDIWNAYRTDYGFISIQTSKGWYTYNLTDKSTTLVTTPNSSGRLYIDSQSDAAKSIWADKRDGQGVLLLHNKPDGKDTIMQTQAGLTYPIRWLTDNTVIYRVVSGSGASDYAFSLAGGAPARRIADVANTTGFTQ